MVTQRNHKPSSSKTFFYLLINRSRISQSENSSIPPTTTVTQPILSSDDYSTWASNIMKDLSIMVGKDASGGRIEKPMLKAGNAYNENRVKRDSQPKVRGAEINAVEHPHGGRPKHHHIGGDHVSRLSTTVRRDTSPGKKVGVERNSFPKVRGVGINPVEHPDMTPNLCYIGGDRVRSVLINTVEHPLAGPNHIYIGGDRLSTVPRGARRTGRLRGQAAAAKADKA